MLPTVIGFPKDIRVTSHESVSERRPQVSPKSCWQHELNANTKEMVNLRNDERKFY